MYPQRNVFEPNFCLERDQQRLGRDFRRPVKMTIVERVPLVIGEYTRRRRPTTRTMHDALTPAAAHASNR